MEDLTVPQDVLDIPAGPDGNGFVLAEIVATSVVGSDGRFYVRIAGVVSIAPETETEN